MFRSSFTLFSEYLMIQYNEHNFIAVFESFTLTLNLSCLLAPMKVTRVMKQVFMLEEGSYDTLRILSHYLKMYLDQLGEAQTPIYARSSYIRFPFLGASVHMPRVP
jgi:hypothetical protein